MDMFWGAGALDWEPGCLGVGYRNGASSLSLSPYLGSGNNRVKLHEIHTEITQIQL